MMHNAITQKCTAFNGHKPTAAYQGSSRGLRVLQTPPTRTQVGPVGVCWSCHGAMGREGDGVGGSLTNVLKVNLSNINLNS